MSIIKFPRKIFCEIVEGAVYEDRCLYKLSKVVEGNPTCKNCIIQELEVLKGKKGKKIKCLKKFKTDHTFPDRDGFPLLNVYDTKTVSHLLNIPIRTIQKWAEKGEIPAEKIGSKWKYPKKEIDQLLKEKKLNGLSTINKPSRDVDNGGSGQISQTIEGNHSQDVEEEQDPRS